MKKTIVIILIVIVLIMALWRIEGLGISLERGARFFAVPLWRIGNGVRENSADFFSYMKTKKSLEEKNVALKKRIDEMGMQLLLGKFYAEENENLKKMLGRRDVDERMILAAVLAKPPRTAYDSLILDIGREEGVAINNRVFASPDVAIGEIESVSSQSSKVILYSSFGETTAALLGDGGITITAKGRGGGNFKAELPRDIEVSTGDIIRLPGLEPKVIGIVGKVSVTPTDSFQTVLFSMPLNLYELEWVRVEIASPTVQ